MTSQVDNENPQTIVRNATQRGRIPLFPNEPQTLAELFVQAFEKHARSDALNYKKDGKWHRISSAEMIERSENIALGLYSLGLRKNDKAAILAANSPEWTLTDAGCQFAGFVDVPVYTTLAPAAVEYIVKDSGAQIFFVQNKECLERLKPNLDNCPQLKKIVLFTDDASDSEKTLTLAELEISGAKLKSEQPELLKNLREAIEPSRNTKSVFRSRRSSRPEKRRNAARKSLLNRTRTFSRRPNTVLTNFRNVFGKKRF